MKKTYVLDTNILIQAPYALNCFKEHTVVIPLVVIEELDGLKKADGERGANARKAIRILEEMRLMGDLFEGVRLPEGGLLRIEKNFINIELPPDMPDNKADNRILMVCKGLKEQTPEQLVTLVTKDLVMRLKADMIGVQAEDFTTEEVSPDDALYTGRT